MTNTSNKLPALSHKDSLKTLVEHRRVYTLKNCEFNLFETYQAAELVPLKFNDVVITSMLRGKKVMHLFEDSTFEYLPGETLILPQKEQMLIDFPEAEDGNPTQCMALSIDFATIKKTIEYLNEHYPMLESLNLWNIDFKNYLFKNEQINGITKKLIHQCMSDASDKDLFIDLSLQELLVRILQAQNLEDLGQNKSQNGMINMLANYVKENISLPIEADELSKKAKISSATLYRMFKNQIGISPKEFILNEKIKHAKSLLRNPNLRVQEISYEAGFADCSYFIRLFKKMEGITPKAYRTKLLM